MSALTVPSSSPATPPLRITRPLPIKPTGNGYAIGDPAIARVDAGDHRTSRAALLFAKRIAIDPDGTLAACNDLGGVDGIADLRGLQPAIGGEIAASGSC